jgi:hypothetical protein
LATLAELPLDVQDQWFAESETLDLWMMFDKKPLSVQVANRTEEALSDERERLLYKLMKEYPQFQSFEGTNIYTEFDHRADPIIWKRTKITPYKICVQEGN